MSMVAVTSTYVKSITTFIFTQCLHYSSIDFTVTEKSIYNIAHVQISKRGIEQLVRDCIAMAIKLYQ